MTRETVLSVGQCGPDHTSSSRFLERHFDVEIFSADLLDDTQETVHSRSIDLMLINRKLDAEQSDGLVIFQALKTDPGTAGMAVIIVSNNEDAQKGAVAAGAVQRFGKTELNSEPARERVHAVLGE